MYRAYSHLEWSESLTGDKDHNGSMKPARVLIPTDKGVMVFGRKVGDPKVYSNLATYEAYQSQDIDGWSAKFKFNQAGPSSLNVHENDAVTRFYERVCTRMRHKGSQGSIYGPLVNQATIDAMLQTVSAKQ